MKARPQGGGFRVSSIWSCLGFVSEMCDFYCTRFHRLHLGDNHGQQEYTVMCGSLLDNCDQQLQSRLLTPGVGHLVRNSMTQKKKKEIL